MELAAAQSLSPSPTPSPAAPDGPALLALEKRVRQSGSGLTVDELIGCWWLDRVWPKGQSHPSELTGALLRSLGARLEIRRSGEGLQLSNAVALGPLELRFEGPGQLIGRRPLLQFQFERLLLRFSGRPLLERPLPPPAAGRTPFFALLGRGAEGWLAARGRGGGLALWRLRQAEKS